MIDTMGAIDAGRQTGPHISRQENGKSRLLSEKQSSNTHRIVNADKNIQNNRDKPSEETKIQDQVAQRAICKQISQIDITEHMQKAVEKQKPPCFIDGAVDKIMANRKYFAVLQKDFVFQQIMEEETKSAKKEDKKLDKQQLLRNALISYLQFQGREGSSEKIEGTEELEYLAGLSKNKAVLKKFIDSATKSHPIEMVRLLRAAEELANAKTELVASVDKSESKEASVQELEKQYSYRIATLAKKLLEDPKSNEETKVLIALLRVLKQFPKLKKKNDIQGEVLPIENEEEDDENLQRLLELLNALPKYHVLRKYFGTEIKSVFLLNMLMLLFNIGFAGLESGGKYTKGITSNAME